MNLRTFYFLSLLFLLPHLGQSQTLSTAGEGLAAMDLPTGAKAAALGGAFSAWADDTTAVYWNPAGMVFIPKIQVQTAFNQWYQDTFFQDFGGVLPTPWGALGARVSYINLGSFTGRDSSGYLTGKTYSPTDLGGSFAAAVKLGALAVGLSAKGYMEALPDDTYGTFGIDAGALLRLGALSLSGGARNLGLVSNYSFPTEAYTGSALAWDLGPLDFHLATDASFTTQGTELHHGVELGYQKTVFLRGGYQWFLNPVTDQDQTGLSGGVGLALSDVRLDYALVSYGDLGSTNQVSISYQFDLAPKKAADAEDAEDYGTTPVTPAPKPRAIPEPAPKPKAAIHPIPNDLSTQAIYHLGVDAYKRKDYDQALVYFKNAGGQAPTDDKKTYVAEANVMLGVLYEYHQSSDDHLAQAEHYYNQALKLEPDNPTVQKHLAALKTIDDDR